MEKRKSEYREDDDDDRRARTSQKSQRGSESYHSRRRSRSRDRPSRRSRSRSREKPRRSRSRSREQQRDHRRENSKRTDDKVKYEYGKKEDKEEEPIVKEKPTLEVSGNLLKDTNTYNGVVVKYAEPPEARKSKKRWRLYCFKGDQELPFYQIHRQSAYLFGKDRAVADIPIDHPSCSKQHAVFQYRLIDYQRKDGSAGRVVKPYIIDLGSTNGTYVNNSRIEPQRYFELREKDVIKFGYSSRDFILLHEESKGEPEDDDYQSNPEDSPKKD